MIIGHYSLDRNFIAVAAKSDLGGWCCFGMVVNGRNHKAEADEVPHMGTRIEKRVACAMFPDLDPTEYDTGFIKE